MPRQDLWDNAMIMANRHFAIDFRNLASYEPGAILLTLLAHPEPEASDETLGRLQRTLCHLHLKAKADNDPDWAATVQPIKPLYAFADPKHVQQDLRQFKRRLRDRMVAARMAIAFLQEVQPGKAARLPNGIRRLSLNALSLIVLDDLDMQDDLNVETRVWRPSLPVIHLAAAVAVLIDQVEKAEQVSLHLGHFLVYPDLVRQVIQYADEYATLLMKSTKLKLQPDILIRIKAVG